jgi:DNA repair protein SbcC/Rad50
MRLRTLRISRLPGIRPGFTLDAIDPGINVVVGPNASGKSSLLRALRAVLYREEARQDGVDIEAVFEDDAGELRALRVGADLQWSRAGQRVEAPPLPDHRFLSCYTLRIEDLLDLHDTDSEITAHIARDLAGGYDLKAIRVASPFSRKEANTLGVAEREFNRQVQARRGLQNDEGRLAELRQQKEAAGIAAREAEACERALALLEAQRLHRGLEQQRNDFPPGMDKLRGDELESLDDLQRQLAALAADLARAERDRDARDVALQETRLDGVDIDAARINDSRQDLQRLHRLESDLARQHKDLSEAIAQYDDAVGALGGVPDQLPDLEPATIHAVEQQLVEKRTLDATIAQLEAEHKATQPGSEPVADPERLREARRELLYWLATPHASGRSLLNRIAISAAMAAAIAGIGIAALLLHLAMTILLLPLAWGLYILLNHGTGDARRSTARERFLQTGILPPMDWSREAVLARLDELEMESQQAMRNHELTERHGRTEREIAERRAERDTVIETLQGLAGRVGFDPQSLDASFERWIRLVARYDHTRVAVATGRAELQRIEGEMEALRNPLLIFLTEHGEAPGTPSPDATTLSQRLEQLTDRIRRRDENRRAIEETDREIRRLGKALADQEQLISALFLRIGLDNGDETGLRQRLERWPAWQDLSQQMQEARTREFDRRGQLGDRPDLIALVEADDDATLRNQLDALREQAAEHEKLINRIAYIESAIDTAGRERALERARAQRQRAEDALRERYDEALLAEANHFLLDEIAAEHVRESQPAALRQATEWFGHFTRHQYELEFDRDGDGLFSALETGSGERRALSQLSSGTRMQLLLAVRIAYALEAERGREPLPLILDEALTTADPERFAAVADSLRLLATDNQRQILYLTAQPGDVAYWASRDSRAHVIDLAALRGRERAITDPDALMLPGRPEVPEPGTLSAEEYAVQLGVPMLDPWLPAAEIPVFHLLRDDLVLVGRLYQSGFNRLGPLRSLLASDAVHSLLSEDERHRLQARTDGAETWLEAWRVGHGRPVDRHALEASGAVSDAKLDEVAARCEELDGNGEALIQSLAAGDVKHFYTSKREELAQWLTDHGHIDPREVLSPAEIELRVIDAMRPHLPDSDDDTVIADARRLADSLAAAMRFTNREPADAPVHH